MSCKLFLYKGSELNEQDLITALARDAQVVEDYRSQEEREGTDYEREDSITFQKKVDALQKSMNVEVIYDDNIESSRLLGLNDPRTKAAGKPVILINPNQLFKTTAIHEFAHVFIDSFPGGLENKRLQRALDQLRDSDLWTEVKALYPELSTDMLHKEILATAIGREGSEIWADAENKSQWESFMAWLSDYLSRTFGLERSEVVSLSKELLSNKVKAIDVTKTEVIAQQMKGRKVKGANDTRTEVEKDFDALQSKVEKGYNELVNVVTKVYKNQKNRVSTPAGMKKEARNSKRLAKKSKKLKLATPQQTRLESITALKDKLDKYDSADRKMGFVRYLNWAKNELYFMKTEIDKREDEGSLDSETLRRAYDWSASFSVLEDVQSLLENLQTTSELDTKEVKTIRELMSYLQGTRKEIDSKLLKGSRAIYAGQLAKYDTQTEEEYKIGFRETYAELGEESTGMQEGEYVIQELSKHKLEIEDVKLRIAEARAEESLTRMSKLSMVLLSEKEMKAKDIQLISTLLDKAQQGVEKYATEEATNVDVANKEFRSKVSDSRNMKIKYKNMFTVSQSGESYYTGEYSPDFLEDMDTMNRESGDDTIYDEKYKGVVVTPKVLDSGVTVYEYESNILNKNGNKIKRQLIPGDEVRIEGAENLKEGERAMHVSIKLASGKRMTLGLNQAIARSESKYWIKENTKKYEWVDTNGMSRSKVAPIEKWENPVWKELQEDKNKGRADELVKLKENAELANKMYEDKSSLITRYKGVKFMRLPGAMKTSASRIREGQSVKTMSKAELSKMIETQQDDFDVQSYTDFKEGETLRIQTPYRARLQETDQSYDLHTIGLLHSIMAKNYQEKKAIESSLIVITEVMHKKKYPVIDLTSGLQKIDAQTDALLWEKEKDSEEYNKAMSILENRLYGITTKQSVGLKIGDKVVEAQQVVKTGLKYFGMVSLVFNYANSMINTTTGTFSNLIEAIGGDVYNLSDYKQAQQWYNFDLKNIMKDIGSNVSTSKTNLLMSNFNAMGPAHLNTNFEKGSKMEGLFKEDSLRPLANMGEHMMQAKVMYAVLSSIKAQNSKGTWIDVNGNPVKSKKQAASLKEMISFKENAKGGQEMVLHPSVQNTSFTTTGGQESILLETRNLIRSKIDELHGQYTNDIQAHAQRHILGKLGFFLRKWMIPGYVRRFRGATTSFKHANADLTEAQEFYSSDQKVNMEGYYISTMRFLSTIVADAREDGVNISKSWNSLSPKQRAGVRKSMVDIASMTAITLAYAILEGDGDIDDEDIFLAYLLRRQQSELTTFLNPIEAFKIASTPTAAVGNLKNMFKVMNYMLPGNWGERYETGKNKGDLKIFHKSRKLVPWPKGVDDFRVSLDFLRTTAK